MMSIFKHYPKYILSAQFYTPDNIASLMSRIGELFNHKTVVDPACGLGNILFHCGILYSDSKLYGYDINEELIIAAKDFFGSVDAGTWNVSYEFQAADSLKINFRKRFDLIVTHFPFGNMPDRGRYEFVFLKKCLSLLKREGCLICVVPNNFLVAPYYKRKRDEILNQ